MEELDAAWDEESLEDWPGQPPDLPPMDPPYGPMPPAAVDPHWPLYGPRPPSPVYSPGYGQPWPLGPPPDYTSEDEEEPFLGENLK